jgi:hypothetical protein
MSTNRLLKEKEVLELLQCSSRHLSNLRRRRLLAHFRVGRSIRYRLADIEAALSKLRVEAVR